MKQLFLTSIMALALFASLNASAYTTYVYDSGESEEETGGTITAECEYDDRTGELLGCN